MTPPARRPPDLRTSRFALALVATLFIGATLGAAVGRATAAPPITVPAELQRSDLVQPFDDLFQAYHIVTTQSYYAPVLDPRALIAAATNGLLSGGTGDPHTVYLSPGDTLAAEQALNGSVEGIGVYLSATVRGVRLTPLPGSPAAHAGLQRGDLIVRIGGRDVTLLSEAVVIGLLRGALGTPVRLEVERDGVNGLITATVIRARVRVVDVVARTIGMVAYLHIAQFGPQTGATVRDALRRLLSHRPRALILDLRDNPGGLVATALDVASAFLPAGNIVLWQQDGRHHLDPPLYTLGAATAAPLPLVALVNDGTASAAEIVAGALRDDRRVPLIGLTTYGKGSVQQEYPLADGSSLRLTTRLWITPQRHSIQNVGLVPDLIVDSPVADGSVHDRQLARALQLVSAGRAVGAAR